MAPDERSPKLKPVTDDSFAALIRLFMSPANPKWMNAPPMGYSPSTRETWGRELRFMAHPDCLGAFTRETIRPSVVQAYFDGIADRPGKQASGLTALKQLEKWAIVRELLPRQITLGVEIGSSDAGHIPWDDDQVALGELHGGEVSRAVTLAANTGQRGSDLVRMGPTDIEVYQGIRGINVRQQKTSRIVWIPITSELDAALATWERTPGPFLRSPSGAPWTRILLSHAWTKRRDTTPELAPLRREHMIASGRPWEGGADGGLVLHGLRGTACVRLRRAGAPVPQIADMVGMSEDMVARYCRFSAQRENAAAAVVHLERTIRERSGDMGKKGTF